MSTCPEAFSLHAELAAVQVILADLQRRWPDDIALEPERKSDYYKLPYLFREAFPALAGPELRPLAVFCKLYAGSILLHDQIIDGGLVDGANRSAITTSSLRLMAMHAEAYHQLHTLFPAGAAFWDRLRSYVAAYTDACLAEKRFAAGDRPWPEYTEAEALRIVIGKNGPARIIAAAMVELARDERMLEPLLDVTNAFNVATQMWDDLQDWKEDLRQGTPTLLLARLIPERPAGLDGKAGPDLVKQLARELYYGGHARHVLELVLTALDQAEQLQHAIPDLGLYAVTATLRRKCEALYVDIERIVRANVQRARDQPRLALVAAGAGAAGHDLVSGALRYLETQWNAGFGEARDLIQYPEELGFAPAETCHFGDVFQRALVTDTLCDADAVLDGRLQPIIEREASYLVSQRAVSATGGWCYYADLPELPPDADDLAQVMQVLIRAGRRDEVARHGEPALAVLLRDNCHPDGSFETWIVPASGRRTPLEERHAKLVERVWGVGPDCDVIPNLLYALHLYDAARFADPIRDGARYLEAQQRADGTWTSQWYAGPYYAIYVCLRMFDAVAPASPAVARALRALRDTQRSDGGWGLEGAASDPLATALALLGLAAGQRACADHADPSRAARGIEYLRRTMESDGGWPSHALIFKGFGAFHGSRTLTTAFALKAALAWQDRRAGASIAVAS